MSTDLEGEFTSALKARERAREIGTTAYHAFRGTTTRVIRVIYSVVILAVAGYSFVGWVKKPSPPPPPVNKSAAPGYEGIVPPETRIIDLVPGEEGVVSSRGYRRVSFDPKGGCIVITRPDGHQDTDCPGMSISAPPTNGGEFIIRPVNGPVRVVVVLQK